MEAARAWSVPRSIFLGRVPARDEPLWLDDDRQWAIALLEYESELCDGCGQHRDLSMSPDHESDWVTSAMRCHACAAVARGSEAFTSAPYADPRGLLIGVQLKEGRRV